MVKTPEKIVCLFSPLLLGLGLVLLSMITLDQAQAQTPVPTGTPIAPDIITNTGTLTGLVDIPGPLAIPTITYTIDYSPFWDIDTLGTMFSIVQTIPTFGPIQTFIKIFVPIISILIGIKIVQRILGVVSIDKETGSKYVQVGKRKIEL